MERQIAKLKKDTYKTRRAEGRPKHGQTSFAVLGIGLISWLLLMVALFMPEWRTNWLGLLGYAHKRSWGLMSVVGMKSKMHHEAMQDACRFFSQLTVVGVCASPICIWYRTKCQIYMDLMAVSYASMAGFIFAVILHTLCIIWTMRMTPRMLRWSAIWWVAQVIIHASIVMFWWLMTSESFASLDAQSMYPEPDFAFCFYIECFVVMLLTTNSILGITLMKMWPEESSDDDDSEDSDEDSDGGPRGPGPSQHMMGHPGYDPHMMPPQQMMGQSGYDPNMMAPQQMMGQPGFDPNMVGQPGFDPNMGAPQQMMGQPGFDPNMGAPQQMMGQPGFDPNMGAPQQVMGQPGFDPNMGAPQQMMGQPGFDPNMGQPGFDPNMGPAGFDPSQQVPPPPGYGPGHQM
jgi:hypothetical protein